MKKVMAVLLALCLLAGAVPVFAGAADGDFEIEKGELKKYNGPGGHVEIPDGVVSIGMWAFKNCTGMTSVTIPDSVEKIWYSAFMGCSNLSEITIPRSVIYISSGALSVNCFKLKNIYVDKDNPVYTDVDGIVFSKDKETLVTYPQGKEAAEYEIPDGVVTVGDSAFSCCSKLTRITIPDSVKSIGSGAFFFCTRLARINIPAKVTKIQTNTFYDCNSLKEFYYGGSEAQWQKVEIDNTGNGNYPLYNLVIYCTGVDEPDPPDVDPDPVIDSFTDVKPGTYCADAVKWAVKKGITAGKGNNTFKPDDKCTRGEIVTFLWRSAGKPEPSSAVNPFKDVREDGFYYKAVLWAVENKITSGTSSTTFGPEGKCSRSEAVTFMWRAEKEPAAQASGSFKDVASGAFYADAVNWAVENGITAGKGTNTFKPKDMCTRGEIVTFLYRANK